MNGGSQTGRVIQWFPGHMAKTFRMIQAELRNVDVVIELLDARTPFSSKNPMFEQLTKGKPKLTLLNKSDLAEPDATKEWIAYYNKSDINALSVISKDKKTRDEVIGVVGRIMRPLKEKKASRGIKNLRTRAMLLGIPNVGKSTLINTLALGAPTKVADKPGVTRGKQWIDAGEIELLDMPGALWPKFENKTIADHLAFLGAVNDDIIDLTDLALRLISELRTGFGRALGGRYGVGINCSNTELEILELIARKRGMLISGGEVDYERAAVMLFDELRAGKLGRISLERVSDIKKLSVYEK